VPAAGLFVVYDPDRQALDLCAASVFEHGLVAAMDAHRSSACDAGAATPSAHRPDTAAASTGDVDPKLGTPVGSE
jgi:hypothetical protein